MKFRFAKVVKNSGMREKKNFVEKVLSLCPNRQLKVKTGLRSSASTMG